MAPRPLSYLAQQRLDRLHGPAGADAQRPTWNQVWEQASHLVQRAIAQGASAVHFEPGEHQTVRVRARLARTLVELAPGGLPAPLGRWVVSTLKLRAGLDVTTDDRPQLGRLLAGEQGGVACEVSSLPSKRGEVLVLRLPRAAPAPPLVQAGLDPADLPRVCGALALPGGLLTVTGPPRSGKRTLLQACLRHAATGERTAYSIAAGEPEAGLDGVVQLDLHPEVGYERWHALQIALAVGDVDVLRLDRLDASREVAGRALRGACEGVTILGGVGASDTAEAVLRLVDLGLPAYLLVQELRLVVATRLAARLCPGCRREAAPPDRDELVRLAPRLVEEELLGPFRRAFVPGPGCVACEGRGTLGRLALFEVLAIAPDQLERALAAPRAQARALLRARTRTLREAALLRAEAGDLSVVEALRATPACGEPPLAAA